MNSSNPFQVSNDSYEEVDSFINRVSNSVSEVFSKFSFSNWLNKSNSSDTGTSHQSSNHRSTLNSSGTFINRNNPINSLNLSVPAFYPEEGASNESRLINSTSSIVSSPQSSSSFTQSLHPAQPTNEERKIFSTMRLMNPNSNFLSQSNESINSQSPQITSSKYIQNISPIQENSLALLKKSFPENYSNDVFQPVLSTSQFSSGMKRQRPVEEVSPGPSKLPKLHSSDVECSNKSPNVTFCKRPRFKEYLSGPALKHSFEKESDPSYSLFYPGKIMYGGATNYEKRPKVVPKKMIPRSSSRQKSSKNDSSDGGLSLAAKRILDCINKCDQPFPDSKKIPHYEPSRLTFHSNTTAADFYKIRPTFRNVMVSTPPIKALLTPTKAKVRRRMICVASNVTKTAVQTPRSIQQPASSVSENQKVSVDRHSSLFVKNKMDTDLLAGCHKKSRQDFPTHTASSKNFTTIHTDKNVKKDNDEIVFSFSIPDMISVSYENLPSISSDYTFKSPIDLTCAETPAKSNATEIDVFENWADKFKPKNSWECNVCLIQNESSAKNCIACQTEKSSTKDQELSISQVSVSQSDSSKSVSTLSAGTVSFRPVLWDCEICLLQNKLDAKDCVACLAPKPEMRRVKPSIPIITLTSDNSEQTTVLNDWGDRFKNNSNWECQTCLISNKESANKCVACESARPVDNNSINKIRSTVNITATSPIKAISNNWGERFKPAKDVWSCEICLVQNENEILKCVACKSSRPQQLSKSTGTFKDTFKCNVKNTIEQASTTLNNNDTFRDKNYLSNNDVSKRQERLRKRWECDTCLNRNDAHLSKCVSCDSPKPPNYKDIVSQAITGKFKFGAPKSVISPNSSPFGTALNTSAPSPSNFIWGSPIPVGTSNITQNSFQPNVTVPTQDIPGPKPLNSSYNKEIVFPSSQVSETSNLCKPKLQFPTFSSTTSSTNTTKSLMFPKFPISKIENSTSTQPSSQPSKTATFTLFGKDNTMPKHSSNQDKNNSETHKTSNSNELKLIPEQNSSKPAFSFGSLNGPVPTTSFMFGNLNKNTAVSKLNFSFGADNQTKPVASSLNQKTPETTSSLPAFSFTTDKKSDPPAYSFTADKKSNPPAYSFGAKKELTSFNFNSTSKENLTSKPSFDFSVNKENTTSGMPNAFGSAGEKKRESGNNTPTSLFTFSNNTSKTSAMTFGTKTETSAAATTKSLFSFGPAKNGPLIFGGGSESKNGPSIFGNSTETKASNPSTTGLSFNFGQSNSQSQSNPGFKFSQTNLKSNSLNFAAQTNNAPSMFQFNAAKPTAEVVSLKRSAVPNALSFMSKEAPNNTFSVPASSGGPQRVIKKAFRRKK